MSFDELDSLMLQADIAEQEAREGELPREKWRRLSIEETKEISTEWAARHVLDLREAMKRIGGEVEEPMGPMCRSPETSECPVHRKEWARYGEQIDNADRERFFILLDYCKSEIKRSPSVRASIRLLDQIGAPVNSVWGAAIDPIYVQHESFDIATSYEWDAWSEYFNNNPAGPESEKV